MTTPVSVPEWARVGETVAFIARPVHTADRITPVTITGVGKRYVTVKSEDGRISQRFDMTSPDRGDDGTVWLRYRNGYIGTNFIGPADSVWAREVAHGQKLRERVEVIEKAHSAFNAVQSMEAARRMQRAIEYWIEVHQRGAS